MQDVIKRGTGTAAQLANGMPASGKTGTSEYSTDLWLAAYTPYYTCSVWGGYDSNKPMENIYNQTGTKSCGKISWTVSTLHSVFR